MFHLIANATPAIAITVEAPAAATKAPAKASANDANLD